MGYTPRWRLTWLDVRDFTRYRCLLFALTCSVRLKVLGRESVPEPPPDSQDSTEVFELFLVTQRG